MNFKKTFFINLIMLMEFLLQNNIDLSKFIVIENTPPIWPVFLDEKHFFIEFLLNLNCRLHPCLILKHLISTGFFRRLHRLTLWYFLKNLVISLTVKPIWSFEIKWLNFWISSESLLHEATGFVFEIIVVIGKLKYPPW